MRARMLAVAAVWLASAPPAAGQVFPASLDRSGLLAWLAHDTDIRPEHVVAVTPQALTAIVSSFPAGGGRGPRLVIRAEALSAETYGRTGALSWHVSLNADCQNRKVMLGETTGYPERNLLGERRVLRPAESVWRTPQGGTALENAWRAACEAKFVGPLADEPAPRRTESPAVARRNRTPAAMVAEAAPPPPPLRPPPAVPRAAAPVADARASAGVAVQVGAAASEAQAQALLTALGPQIGRRQSWTEAATVDGRVWRRALVGGFASPAEAADLCARLRSSGRACFVRSTAPPRN